MSDLQNIGQLVNATVKSGKSAATILNAQKLRLNQMILSMNSAIGNTTQSSYMDCVNSMEIAQKKMEHAIGNLLKACLAGENWISKHVNAQHDNLNTDSNRCNDLNSLESSDQYMTTKEAEEKWEVIIDSVDELIEIYREEMTNNGAFDGYMLSSFLEKQRSKMLQYEKETLNIACGKRGPLNEDEVYQYVVVGENSSYGYSDIVKEFSEYCLNQVSSWVSEINPNEFNDPRRETNCGKCAAAVFKRMNGEVNAVAGLGTYSNREMNKITGKVQTPMSPEQIEEYLKNQGAGAHVVVGVDRASGCGHWFNAFYDGTKVYTIEGQGGYIGGWPPDYGDVVRWDVSI